MGTRRTHSISPSPGGYSGTLSALLLWVLGYPEFPLHGFRSMRLAGAGRGAHHAEDRSVEVGAAAKSTGSLSTTGTCPPRSWDRLSVFLVPAICVLGTCFPHSWYLLSAFLVPAIRILGTRYPHSWDPSSAFLVPVLRVAAFASSRVTGVHRAIGVRRLPRVRCLCNRCTPRGARLRWLHPA
jgi:hypothetical protein